MTTPDLTSTLREALSAALDAYQTLTAPQRAALIALRDACPEPPPALEDGIYEVPDEDSDYRLRYVRDGRHSVYRKTDGTLINGGYLLPDDVSGWRRIDGPPTVTPEQFEEAARVASGFSESEWASLSEEARVYLRTRTSKILAAAGVTVHHDDKELT